MNLRYGSHFGHSTGYALHKGGNICRAPYCETCALYLYANLTYTFRSVLFLARERARRSAVAASHTEKLVVL